MRIAVAVLLLSISQSALCCTKNEAMLVEEALVSISSWQDLESSFEAYASCDDGAIADGFTGAISRLMIRSWDGLESIDSGSEFYAFIVQHLDSTWTHEEYGKVREKALLSCPKKSGEICDFFLE